MIPALDRRAFRPDVNGLRAFAVAAVVAFHVARGAVPGGFVGVDIFFVISGYLISRIVLSDLRAGAFRLAGFYAKRVRRIFPALATVLIAFWLAGLWRLDPSAFAGLAQQQYEGALFTLNFRLAREDNYFDAASEAKPLLHLWSLCVEEQFYLVAPLLLALASRVERLVAPALLAIFAASLTFDLVLTPSNPTAAFFWPWGRAWELALGALVAERELTGRAGASRAAAWTGLALMTASLFLLSETQPYPGWRALLPTLGCALVLANAGGADRILARPLLQGLGTISYPLYLWHWPLLAFAYFAYGGEAPILIRIALAGAAVGLAFATWRFVEQPLAGLYARRPSAVVAWLIVALAACAALGRITRIRHGFPGRYPAVAAAMFEFPPHGFDRPLYRAGTCFDDRRYEAVAEGIRSFSADACDIPADPAKPTILILGDSHGAHLYPGVAAVFGEQANVLQINASYCAPLIEHVDTSAGVGGTERCQTVNDYVFARVRALKPQVIVVGVDFELFLQKPDWLYPDFVAQFLRGAARLRQLGGAAVVIAGQVPTWTSALPPLAAREWLANGATPVRSRNGLDVWSLSVDAKLAAQLWPEGVRYVSLIAALCDAEGCLRRVGDDLPQDLMAVDYGHLSQRGSLKVVRDILGPQIEKALQSGH